VKYFWFIADFPATIKISQATFSHGTPKHFPNIFSLEFLPGMWNRKTEAVKAVTFLWKRKHFEERSWKRKQTRKRLTLYGNLPKPFLLCLALEDRVVSNKPSGGLKGVGV